MDGVVEGGIPEPLPEMRDALVAVGRCRDMAEFVRRVRGNRPWTERGLVKIECSAVSRSVLAHCKGFPRRSVHLRKVL